MAGKAKIGAVIALDGEKEFKQAVTNVNKELTNLKSQSSLVKEQFEGQANTLEALTEKHDVLIKVLEAHKKKEKEITNGLNNAKEVYEKYGDKLGELKKKYEVATDKMRSMEQNSKSTKKEIEEQKKEVERLRQGVEKSEKNYKSAADRIQWWETKLNTARTQTLKANRALEQNDEYMKEAKKSTDHCATSIDEYGKKVKESTKAIMGWKESFKTAVAEKALDILTSAMKGLVNTVKEGSRELVNIAKEAAAYADEINTTASITRMSTDELQAYCYATKLVDVSLETLTGTMRKNIKSMSNAQKGTEDYVEAYKKLGVKVTETDGTLRDSESVYWDCIDALKEMSDETERDAVSMQLFGKSATDINPLIAQGSEGIQELAEEAKKMGAILDKDALESLQATQDSLDRLSQSTDIFKRKIGAEMAPHVKNVSAELISIMDDIDDELAEFLGNTMEDCVDVIKWVLKYNKEVTSGLKGIAAALATMAMAKGIQKIVGTMETLRRATDAATIAQEGLNTAQNANAIGLITSLIVGAGVALYSYSKKASEASNETKKFLDAMRERKDAIEESIQSYHDGIEEVEKEWDANQRLIDKLLELNEVQEKTVGQKTEMKGIIDQLSEDIPELATAYNEETGALNMTKDALDGIITKRREYAIAVASQDSLQDLAKQVVEAENMISETEDRINRSKESLNYLKELEKGGLSGMDFNYAGWWDTKKAIHETTKEIEQQEDALGQYKLDYENANQTLNDAIEKSQEYADALSDTEESMNAFSDAETQAAANTSQMTEEQAQAYKELQQSIADSIGSTISVFDEFSGGTEITAEEIKKNLQSQIDGVSNWSENMKILAGTAGKGMTEEFYNYLLDMGPQGANAVQELVNTLSEDETLFSDICKNWAEAMNLEEELSEGLASAYDVGFNTSKGIADGMEDGIQEVKKAANNLTAGVMSELKNNMKIHSPSQETRQEIGVMISRGLALGITDGIPEARMSISELCKAVLGTSTAELDIHSPSRVFRDKVGANISKGVAFGISAKQGEAIKSSKLLANEVYKSASKWLESYKQAHVVSLEDEKYFWNNIAGTVKKGTTAYKNAIQKAADIESFSKKMRKQIESCFSVSEYTENSKGEKEKKSAEDYYGDIYSAASKYFDNYSVLHNVSLEEEEYYWKNVVKQLKKGTQAYYDAQKKLKEVQQERKTSVSEQKESNKNYALSGDALSKYKTYYKVSERAEVQYWDTVRRKFKAGTAERIEADQKYYEAKQAYNDKLEELNQEYYDNCKEVQDKLKDEVQELTDAYNDAVSDRKRSIYSSFNLFDEFSSTSVSGKTLLYNLKTQVAGYADWEQQLSKLGQRGIAQGLMDELSEMGPEASASLHALNSLSDEELKQYEALWEQKNKLAEAQAVKENESLRKQTETQIETLKSTAQAELNAYKAEYTAAVAEVKKSIETPLKELAKKAGTIGEDTAAQLVAGIKNGATKKTTTATLKKAATSISSGLGTLPAAGKTIGDNTLQGIIDGLTNKKKIDASAKSMVESLKKAIQKAADIHSPSRLFKKEIGVQLSAGVAEGMKDEEKTVNTAGEDMIRDLLEKSKQQLARQQAALTDYAASIQNKVGMQELNNLISVAPVQQVTATVDNSGLAAMFGEMLAVMQEGFDRMANMQLITDTGTLIGETSAGMSKEFAMNARRIR